MPKTTSADGTTIAYDVAGSGPPVVIVDGAIMVLVGERSDQSLRTGTRAFAEGMPNATLRSFDTRANESHAVTRDAPATELERFLA